MEDIKCQDCFAGFPTKKHLLNHQKKAKYCKKYRYVLFVCKKCKFAVSGIKNIEEHMETCESDIVFDYPLVDYQNTIKRLVEERRLFQIKSTTLEEKITQHSNILVKLELEQEKNKIYRDIIQNNTNIKIEDLQEDLNDDTLHVTDGYENKEEIPIKIPDSLVISNKKKKRKIKTQKNLKENNTQEKGCVFDDKHTVVIISNNSSNNSSKNTSNNSSKNTSNNSSKNTSPCSVSKEKKISYKTIKNCLKLLDEPSEEEIKTKVALIRDGIQPKVNDINMILETFDKCFDNIEKTRNCNNHLETLKNSRSELMLCMPLPEYIELLNSHIERLTAIFNDKKYTEKKITNSICKCMNSLDMRLLNYGSTYKTMHVDVDVMRRLRVCVNFSCNFSQKHEVFNASDFYNRFYNYSSVIFTIKENIENYLFNIYGFNNIVYVPLPKSSEEDPYSFYSLEKITNGIRNWKMECRLENLSNDFIDNIQPYIVSQFRKLYCNIFHDNEYRKDYSYDSQLTENDCEQLLQSIFILSKPSKFYKIFRNIVKNKSTYEPTIKDKFNLHGDDSLQRRRLNGPVKDPELVNIVKQLFDNISTENAVDFYRSMII